MTISASCWVFALNILRYSLLWKFTLSSLFSGGSSQIKIKHLQYLLLKFLLSRLWRWLRDGLLKLFPGQEHVNRIVLKHLFVNRNTDKSFLWISLGILKNNLPKSILAQRWYIYLVILWATTTKHIHIPSQTL